MRIPATWLTHLAKEAVAISSIHFDMQVADRA